MKSLTSISLQTEPWLEKWARLFRFAKTVSFLREKLENQKTVTLVDFGCGQDTLLYNYIENQFDITSIKYIGIDPLLAKKPSPKNIQTVRKYFEKTNLKNKADVITMLAVLEHVDDPLHLLECSVKALKKNGVIIITTPTPWARVILEFLAYSAGSISKREIDEHKRYPTKASLAQLINQLKNKGHKISAQHQYFELGLNNLLVIHKYE